MPHNERLNPQSLLRLVQQEEKRASRGVLKVFLGYASNVGKTYRLVEELSRRKQRGEDVVVGWAGRCLSPHVQQLVAHLEIVPPLLVDGAPELDVEAILARRPQVCSIDELAHNNPPGSRHATRWEDVLELLGDRHDLTPDRRASRTPQARRELSARLTAVLELVGSGSDTPDELEEHVSDPGDVLLALSELELMGLLVRGDGGRYLRRE